MIDKKLKFIFILSFTYNMTSSILNVIISYTNPRYYMALVFLTIYMHYSY